MEKKSSDRLYSLDLLRGLDMVFLTVVGPLVWAIDSGWGLPQGVLYQFTHPWEGFTAWDIIMPLFLFMCGAAIPLSLERRLAGNGGRPDGAYWRHVFGRVALLWVLGMVVEGEASSDDVRDVEIDLFDPSGSAYPSTLRVKPENGRFRTALPAGDWGWIRIVRPGMATIPTVGEPVPSRLKLGARAVRNCARIELTKQENGRKGE